MVRTFDLLADKGIDLLVRLHIRANTSRVSRTQARISIQSSGCDK
jgi:hypothetical protein